MILEALTTGQLLDRIFAIYRKHFALFFGIAIIPELSRLVIAAVAGTGRGAVAGAVTSLVWFVLFMSLLAIAQGATTVAVSDVYLAKPASVKQSYRRVARMSLRLIGMMWGYSLLVGLGMVLLIVPGFYFLMTYALATPTMAIENVSFSEAMTRSKDLVTGNRGRIFVILLLSWVLSMAISFGLGIPVALLEKGHTYAHSPVLLFVNTGVGMLAGALSMPISLIGFTLAYYDARVRKEAFDLEYMIDSEAAMAASAAAGANAPTTPASVAPPVGAPLAGADTVTLFETDSAANNPTTPGAQAQS